MNRIPLGGGEGGVSPVGVAAGLEPELPPQGDSGGSRWQGPGRGGGCGSSGNSSMLNMVRAWWPGGKGGRDPHVTPKSASPTPKIPLSEAENAPPPPPMNARPKRIPEAPPENPKMSLNEGKMNLKMTPKAHSDPQSDPPSPQPPLAPNNPLRHPK